MQLRLSGPRSVAMATIMRRRSIALAVVSAHAAPLAGQSPPRNSPAWIVQRYFVDTAFPDRAMYLTSELADRAAGPTVGSKLPPGAHVTYRPLTVDSTHAVFAVTLDEGARTEDIYAFLYREDSRWRLGEIRSLSLPGLFYNLLDRLRAHPARSDSARQLLAMMELTVSSDSALRMYFDAHRLALAQLAASAPGSPDTVTGVVAHRLPPNDEHAGCVFLVVGGMVDNTVGFLYAPAGCAVPGMSPHEFIAIEPLAPHWYLYKTT